MANPIAGTMKSNIPFCEHFKLDSLSRIANLVKSANPPNISEQVSIERYFDSIRVMFDMAGSYYNDLQIEKAFILYVRLTQFVNQEMPKHSHYTTLRQEKTEQLAHWTEESKRMFTALKDQIQQTYDEDTLILAESVDEYLKNKDQQSRNTQLRESLEKMQEGTSLRSTVKASFLNSLSKQPDNTDVTPSSEMNEHLAKIIQTKKTMIAPSDLCKSFATHLQLNYHEGAKMCGILCGGWIRDKFVLTHVIVPKQKGTPSSCQAIDKDQVFQCQKINNLIACGWILSDPSNKLSLTANELHTQYAYQCGMQFSVSVLVSPTEHIGKFFTLTDDGMELISQCNKQGEKCLQKQDKSIHQEATHIILGKSLRLKILDMQLF